MQPRNHRAPYKPNGQLVMTEEGKRVAICETPGIANYLAVAGSFFDALTKAARVCLSEYENLDNPEQYPGYAALKKLVNDYESALRGTN